MQVKVLVMAHKYRVESLQNEPETSYETARYFPFPMFGDSEPGWAQEKPWWNSQMDKPDAVVGMMTAVVVEHQYIRAKDENIGVAKKRHRAAEALVLPMFSP